MDYKSALDKAYSEIKPIEKTERFEIPEVKGLIQGNKTIITNFSQITNYIKRQPEHLAKYLAKELATSFLLEMPRLILNRRIKIEKVNEKIKNYVRDYVVCKECKKPDTELLKKDRILFVHCLACGSTHSVPKI